MISCPYVFAYVCTDVRMCVCVCLQLVILCTEMMVDWLKHSFISKVGRHTLGTTLLVVAFIMIGGGQDVWVRARARAHTHTHTHMKC